MVWKRASDWSDRSVGSRERSGSEAGGGVSGTTHQARATRALPLLPIGPYHNLKNKPIPTRNDLSRIIEQVVIAGHLFDRRNRYIDDWVKEKDRSIQGFRAN